MDEFKPEDELKPDPSDRRTGRSRQSSDRDSEPQINFDDVELDADERRPSRSRKAREEAEPEDEYYESDEADEGDAEEVVERRPRKRKAAAPRKPASRQYIMMGLGVVVLLVLIVGIGSALKAPSPTDQSASSEKSISLSGDANTDQANTTQPAQENNPQQQQDVSLPPISSTPTQGQETAAPDGQQRVEVQGDLNNALTQQQGQIDNAVVNSTLPTEPATVAPIRNGARPAVTAPEAPRQTATAPRPERKHAVIEAKPQPVATAKTTAPATQTKPAAEAKPVVTAPKHTETAATAAPVKAPVAATETAKPAATTTAPAATAATAAPAAAATGKSAGDVNSLKTASGSHYTLQLSSSSNYDNLNGWAKKENLKNYVVYETSRNGQPWYVLVSGIYASKDDAKRAVTALPADVQAKNPWAKPLHQVQTDLK